ncbi:MAG: 50S ribosomal protein L35ae [archaeon GB-1867-035]|nr:50S ribosomal protein L35ae [Candidatus Culexmicrobium profundum]
MVVAGLNGVILGYKRGLKRQYPRYVYLKFNGFSSESEASRLIGRRVVWRSGKGLKFIGKIVKLHGRKGVVIARFRTPLPGQAIGSRVVLVG